MRFSEGDYDHPGQWALWENALSRAINGRRGQQVLRDLERALVELPEQALISGSLVDGDSGVCAVGAYVAQKRVEAGEAREDVLSDLFISPDAWGDLDGWEAEDKTITAAQAAGMQLTVAVAVAGLNDDYYNASPQERHAKVLSWVRDRILPSASFQEREP